MQACTVKPHSARARLVLAPSVPRGNPSGKRILSREFESIFAGFTGILPRLRSSALAIHRDLTQFRILPGSRPGGTSLAPATVCGIKGSCRPADPPAGAPPPLWRGASPQGAAIGRSVLVCGTPPKQGLRGSTVRRWRCCPRRRRHLPQTCRKLRQNPVHRNCGPVLQPAESAVEVGRQ